MHKPSKQRQAHIGALTRCANAQARAGNYKEAARVRALRNQLIAQR